MDLTSGGETQRRDSQPEKYCSAEKIKRLRHWLCSSCQLLRGSGAAWRHAPSQPLMRSLLSQFQTPTAPRRAVGFFGFGRLPGYPFRRITRSTSDWPSFNLGQPFRPSTFAKLNALTLNVNAAFRCSSGFHSCANQNAYIVDPLSLT